MLFEDASAFHGVNGYGYGDIGREKLDIILQMNENR